MSISIQQLTLHCRWTTGARLPAYIGSTVRGAFGWALKRCTCMLKHQHCSACILRTSCAYAVLFATELYEDASHGGTINARPHPLVFQLTNPGAVIGQSGEIWDFSLLVIGRGSEFLPHIVHSVQRMGEAGIGAGIRQGLGRFRLEKVIAEGVSLFDAATGSFEKGFAQRKVSLNCSHTVPGSAVHQLHVHLHTPLRLKQKNSLQTEIPFHVFIRAALRRISALEIAYGHEEGGEPALDYQGLVRRAEEVCIKKSTLRWQELQRYSNRQEKKVSLSGLMGTVTYEGDLAAFVPILHYVRQVHLGKQTVFGLGKIAIEFPE